MTCDMLRVCRSRKEHNRKENSLRLTAAAQPTRAPLLKDVPAKYLVSTIVWLLQYIIASIYLLWGNHPTVLCGT
jgi:hypothetical protein